jgi:foldase protein PrsA
MRHTRHLSTCGALLATAVLNIAACGAGGQQTTAVRVAGETITEPTVDHWTAVMAAGRSVSHFKGQGKTGLRRQALRFLITSAWLLRQAEDEGLAVSAEDVQHRLQQIQSTQFPGGAQEYREYLSATRQTIADATLKARTELTAAKLRRHILGQAPAVTPAQVAAYYQQNKQRFAVPEQREAAVINRKTKAEVDRLKREVLAGKSLISDAQRRAHEGIVTISRPPSGGEMFAQALYAAKANRLEGPIRKGADYVLFKIKRILPATYKPLAEVHDEIQTQLTSQRQQTALTAYTTSLAQHWSARTDCQPKYTVQQCRQYMGPRTPENYLDVK